jgi:DNA modification methylase
MSEGEFTTFLTTVLSNLANQSADGALIYSCMDWRHGYELETASRKAGLKLLNLCVWNKDNGGMGSFYRSKHELVFVFKHGSAPHINNIELGQYGRYRTNVWDYAGANTLRHGRLEELAMHPTVKPVALVADAIKDCTGRGHIVLDALPAAERPSLRPRRPAGWAVRSSWTRATSMSRSSAGIGSTPRRRSMRRPV